MDVSQNNDKRRIKMTNETTHTAGISFLGILTLIFITLKLIGYITWSWWTVLSPLWIPFLFIMALVLLAVCVKQIKK